MKGSRELFANVALCLTKVLKHLPSKLVKKNKIWTMQNESPVQDLVHEHPLRFSETIKKTKLGKITKKTFFFTLRTYMFKRKF